MARGASAAGPQSADSITADALGAHKLYVVEVRHPVEVSGTERPHMTAWLTKRLGYEQRIPDLQAIGLKLVDAIGNEKIALAWLEQEKKIPADTPVRDVSLKPRFGELSFLHIAAWTFDAVGLSAFARRIEDWGALQAVERLNLDGLLALWHPSGSN